MIFWTLLLLPVVFCNPFLKGSDEKLDEYFWSSNENGMERQELERIVGGDFENPPNSNPWQILFLTENMGKPWLNCGGTLLTSKFVLSAAHCLPSLLQNEVIAGASNWCDANKNFVTEPFQQRRKVKKAHTLPGSMSFLFYDKSRALGHLYDIVIIEVDVPFHLNSKVKPAKLPKYRTNVGTQLVVSGWGAVDGSGGNTTCRLKQLTVPVINNQLCTAFYGNTLRSSEICAGINIPGPSSCSGDSGGPLVEKRSSDDATVVGIVSFGQGCIGIDIYTDVYTYLPWIKSVLKGKSFPPCKEDRAFANGNGVCDFNLNTKGCLYDSGDCCAKTNPNCEINGGCHCRSH